MTRKRNMNVCLEYGLFMYTIIYNGDTRRNTGFKTEYVVNNLTRKIVRNVHTVAWADDILYMHHMAFISLLFFLVSSTFSLFFNGPKCPLLLQHAEAQGINRWYRLIEFKLKLRYFFCIIKHYNVFQCHVSA